MAFDTYMEIKSPDVEGESTAAKMLKKIEIYSFSWGASNPTTIGSGSAGISAGKVSVSSFNVMKKTDKTSAKLFQSCCNGQHHGQVIVYMLKATGESGEQDTFLKYTFSDVMVESIQWSGSSGGDDTPTESLSLAFAKVEIEYKSQGKDGKLAVTGQAAWDLTKVSAK